VVDERRIANILAFFAIGNNVNRAVMTGGSNGFLAFRILYGLNLRNAIAGTKVS
jgi:hypothetical protein